MLLKRIVQPYVALNSYLIIDEKTNECAVIDPPRLIGPIVNLIETSKWHLRYILETHVHADFISGAKELKAHFLQKPLICCSGMGGQEWSPAYADRLIQDREELPLGGLRLQARHTPGHTPEHLIWLCYDATQPLAAFTGDLLFVGSVGRPDLLGTEKIHELTKQLYNSLFEKLQDLPDQLEIFPAHGAGSLCGKGISTKPSSTLREERLTNPALQKKTESNWIATICENMPAFPNAFVHIKKANVKGIPSPPLVPLLSAEKFPEALILDIRDPYAFAAQHAKGAINVPFGNTFCTWLSMMIPPNQTLLLVVPDKKSADAVIPLFQLLGYDNLLGYGIWDPAKFPTESLNLITAENLAKQLSEIHLIDVRTPSEWNAGHIASAQHIELASLPHALKKIPRDRPIAVICGSGFRASLAASWLSQQGFPDVANVEGGMQAWQRLSHSTD